MLRKLSFILVMGLACFIWAVNVSGTAYAAGGNSHYSLSGAVYQLYTDEACTAAAVDKDGNNAVLTTDEDGNSNTLNVATGTYYAKEVTPSKGFRLDTAVYTVEVTASNTESAPASFTSVEQPVCGVPELMVFKTDPDRTMDHSRLTGAEFTVRYYDAETRPDVETAEPKAWWTFKTIKKNAPEEAPPDTYWAGFDWQNDEPLSSSRSSDSVFFSDDSGKRVMPLGWFTIEETKAPTGFQRTDKVCYGHIYQDENGNAAIEVEDAKDDSKLNVKTLVIENKPNDTYVMKIDSVTEKPVKGAKMQVLKGEEVIDEWVSETGEHKIAGLEPGSYTLRELSAPYGYDIADDITFTASDSRETHVTMKNSPLTLETSAVDGATGKHIGSVSNNETITDNVHLKGLHAGRTYKITGRLMDKSSGKPVKGSGKDGVTASKEFTAESDEMNVTVDFTIDSSSLAPGAEIVVFETLHRTSKVHDEPVPAELQKHEDLNDNAQTIRYPGISTKASLQSDKREVVDVIEYEGLLPEEKYMFRGWLVDTVTGEKVPESDGYVPLADVSETSGTTEMILRTEKYEEMQGHSMTAFEELYVVREVDGADKEILIAEHKDRNDTAQTVEIYHDLKIQKKVSGNLGDHAKAFDYSAEFTGLIPEQAYTVEGDDSKVFNADPNGKARVPLKLGDGQSLTIKMLPKSAQYRITEAASDHVAEFKVFSEDMGGKGAVVTKASGSNKAKAAKDLSTAFETVDLFDGTVVVAWENSRDLATVTAVQSDFGIWACAMAVVIMGIVMLLIIKRKNQIRTGGVEHEEK